MTPSCTPNRTYTFAKAGHSQWMILDPWQGRQVGNPYPTRDGAIQAAARANATLAALDEAQLAFDKLAAQRAIVLRAYDASTDGTLAKQRAWEQLGALGARMQPVEQRLHQLADQLPE